MEGVKLIAFPEPRQRATVVALMRQLDDAVLQSGRDGGQHVEGGIVFNEDGADVDFRVESDTEPNALFVDGATGRVGIGTSTPEAQGHFDFTGAGLGLMVQRTDFGTGSLVAIHAAGGDPQLRFDRNGDFWSVGNDAGVFSIERSSNLAGTGTGLYLHSNGNLGLFGIGSFGGGTGVLSIADRTTAPSSNPTGGGIVWSESGSLKHRSSGGAVTTLGDNVGFFGGTDFQGGDGVIHLPDATTNPTGSPSSGLILYSKGNRPAVFTTGAGDSFIPVGPAIKVIAGAPYTNDGYVTVYFGSSVFNLMTTAG